VQCENIKKERNTFILKLQRTAANREAIKKERDSLKRQIENLRAQYNDAALLENELNIVRAQCDINQKRERLFEIKSPAHSSE
jgi:predicted  nucleic acid-binding Zn-ribbon protein